ncbi:hypothetical protein M409DRAFT_49967 [Zasmidium cellare ATCC 36951]|uniref:Cytochrome b5 heme-binding domain-containing protein n=1 Tax=Zasmidium cellare ATCC 36951 TaxID=1080233 RepID=A0A6A6CZR0_ZASCE|nr:uncharacterized protein M409DRAFT_49967 [Zasmidium cellare ATCC 36951]KAF2172243.1 hypothetical protein M409DRAFT_49967 [Zasmidium cellare ATCC 36951]
MFLAVTILLLSLAFLAYKYPEMLRGFLPSWFAPGQQNGDADQVSGKGEEPSSPEIKLDEPDGETTPKAKPVKPSDEVPSFILSDDEAKKDESSSPPSPPVPSFPAANSAQRASAMPPPPRPTAKSTSGLMPPPPRPTPSLRPNPTTSLRIPTTGPLPNRGPPPNSQQRVSSSLSPNTTIKTPSTRGKVLLSPGHSPMDWAALTKTGNLSGVSTFQRVTPSHLKTMTGRKGKPAWSSWQGKVYNITPYLPFHPGGEAELMKAAGRDGTKLFMDVHPWVNWENMLEACLVGVLVPEDYGVGAGGESSLEDMD